MWLIREDFASVVAFVGGCNQATAGTLLTALQPWLVRHAGCLDNHVWWSIVAHLTRTHRSQELPRHGAHLGARTVETLFDLLDEFLELRDERDSLNRIFAAHEQWRRLREQNGCSATDAPTCPTIPWPRTTSRIKPSSPSRNQPSGKPGKLT
ncbi:hypothetical protein [Micromonospora chersina]|uniref:hypothetical protein n=1 Tax=Micromonospora chersina TaxID=47854 RepID=UPI0037244D54